MATARARFTVHLDGATSETVPLSVGWSLTTAVGNLETVNLVIGANTITVPSGAKLMLFIPPVTNAAAITWKGVAGDTGIAQQSSFPVVFPVNAGSFVLNAAVGVPGCLLAFF